MAAYDTQTYPRPDFERNPLRWQSLNGPWDFIFDDDDVGLSQCWQQSGIPDKVTFSLKSPKNDKEENSKESDSITQKIASGTQELIKDNLLSKSTEKDTQNANTKREIIVPYVFQSPASGINDRDVHEVLWYERTISDLRSVQDKENGHRLVLRFGAVDYVATVWVNGQHIGGHRGGHVPFELDVTDAIDAAPDAASPNRVTLRVYDSAFDLTQPRGKQYWGAQPESIFYTPSGGIWQNVWLEVVPVARIADGSAGTVIQSHDIYSGELHSKIAIVGRRAAQELSVELEASFAGIPVAKSDRATLRREADYVDIDLSVRLSQDKQSSLPQAVLDSAPLGNDFAWRDGVALWSPEHPQLYDLTMRLFDGSGQLLDQVKTTTGMRSINWTKGDGHWRLNDKPYFQALCLDQGYWPGTFMTPPSPESLKRDIELAKKMGFNGCRKHQKVEDPLFYYWADRLGYLVWGEMANAYQFSQDYVERYDQEWKEAVRLVINRPCIVTWTPVNESWGYTSLVDSVEHRNHVRSLYYQTKVLDPTRSINDNCGWEHVLTDLTTFHDYADGPELEKTCADLAAILGTKAGRNLFVSEIPGKQDAGARHLPGAPVMCTEFGGVNIAPAAGRDRDWGYTTASDPEDLLKRFGRLVHAVTGGGHCCAFVYTQLSDIEQETNGLYSFNREEKLDSARVKATIEEAVKAYYGRVTSTA